MVNYYAGDVRKIMGRKTGEIETLLGYKHDDEVVHRDNLVITVDMMEGNETCR